MFDAEDGRRLEEIDWAQSIPIGAERSMPWESVCELLVREGSATGADNLLIDLGGPDETDVASPPAIVGLVTAVPRLLKDWPKLTIGILLPVAIDPSDLTYPMLQLLLENPRVRLLAADGTAQGNYFAEHPQSAEDVVKWSTKARRQPLESLTHKLVRRVGQYKLPETDQVIRNFYDGSRAFNEIYELLETWLRERKASGPIRSVAYDVQHSEWFRGPVEAALNDAGLQDVSRELSEGEDNPDILILPIVRTGRSLTAWFQGREERSSQPPIIWSLLSAHSKTSRETGVRRLPVRSSDGNRNPVVNINYALRVEADANQKDTEFWQSCAIDPIDPGLEDLGGPFSADAMWGMIFEAGVIPEKTVPKRRPPIGLTPDFGKIAQLNGSLIAAKVEAFLRQTYREALPYSLAFLCPEEDHARELAKALQGVAGHDTIMIGRELIEAFVKSSEPELPFVGPAASQFTEVESKLKGLSELAQRNPVRREQPQIVLLDEFNTSGSTFGGLYNISDHFRLSVLCAISLARYAPITVALPTKQHALYELGATY